MSINDTHIMPPADPVSFSPPDAGNDETAGAFPLDKYDVSGLSHDIREASLSSIMPRLQTAFACLDSSHNRADDPSERVLEKLSANITLLQDRFMDALYDRLHTLDVNSSIKLTLRLTEEAGLVVAGEHPDAESINGLLASDLDLIEAFVEIAAQSAALRDLRSLRTLTLYDRASDAYAALAAGPGECMYQLSLKGEMNHFYFTR